MKHNMFTALANGVRMACVLSILFLAGCNASSPPAVTPAPPPALTIPGVVLYYPFSGNANDLSGSQNNGQVSGAVLTSDRFGNPNHAYYFDGVDDYIAFDPAGLPRDNSPRTISAWIQVESYPPELYPGLGSRPSIIGWGTQDWDQLSEMQLVDGKLQFHTYSADNRSGSITMDLGKWTHLAIVYTEGKVFLYVNDIAEEFEASRINTPGGTGRIGTWPDPPQELAGKWKNLGYFHGAIDDVSVYSQALAAAQIKALYTESGWGK